MDARGQQQPELWYKQFTSRFIACFILAGQEVAVT